MVITIDHHFNGAGKRGEEFVDIAVPFLQELLNSNELNVRHEDYR